MAPKKTGAIAQDEERAKNICSASATAMPSNGSSQTQTARFSSWADPDKLKLRAVEMEAGGVVRAINAFPSDSRPSFGMVRGICDDASVGKDDKWHGLAADLAAAFAMEFIFWHASGPES